MFVARGRAWQALDTLMLSPTSFRLMCWYFALLLPTLAFKYLYLEVILVDGVAAAIQPLLVGSNVFPRWVYVLLLYTSDVLEVFVLLATLVVLGHLLLRIRTDCLIFASVLGCLLIGGANYLCSRQVGRLLTLEILKNSFNWARGDPQIIMHFVSLRKATAFSVAVLWAFAPVLVSKRAVPGGPSREIRSYVFPAATVVVLLVAGLLHATVGMTPERFTSPRRGYWSSATLTLLEMEETNPLTIRVPPVAQLADAYRRLAFPTGAAPEPSYLVDIPAPKRRPRHIVLISLETAPRKYYPITSSPDLPAFHRMSRHALVGDSHYTTAPFTTWAIYSMLSGTYPRRGALPSKYGNFTTDGLAPVLANHGYEATYIDSSVILEFWQDYRRMLNRLGFTTIVEAPPMAAPGAYRQSAQDEERTFDRALQRLADAAGRGRKAIVCIVTTIGHFPWVARTEDESLSGKERVLGINKLFDRLLGSFLDSLAERRLSEEVIIVVTGDHGLRFRAEFESLQEEMQYGDAAFNVPFLMYAPGLFPTQVRLPHVTSHTDITPTLLYLIGLGHEHLFYHGGNLLDRRVQDRITFLMSAGLYPSDGFHWRGYFFTQNNLTGQVNVRRGSATSSLETSDDEKRMPLPDHEVGEILHAARDLFDTTAAYFLQREGREAQGSRSGQ